MIGLGVIYGVASCYGGRIITRASGGLSDEKSLVTMNIFYDCPINTASTERVFLEVNVTLIKHFLFKY